MLEKNGVRIAAVSYDSQEILRGFADKHGVGFPLLSDHDSTVIRRFGIFNTNIAAGLRAHGVPHPVEYLVAPDGKLIRKYFVDNYQHRVTASAVVLHEFGVVGEQAPMITLHSGALTLEIGLSSPSAFAGQEIGLFANFKLEPGWHVYGTPLPDHYTAGQLPSTIRRSYGNPLNFRRHGRWKSRGSVRHYRCTVVRSKGWVRYCSNFQSSRVKPCCQGSSAFSNVVTRRARHRRRSRSSCR